MRSKELDLKKYDTDKINHYMDIYDPILAPLVHQPLKLLEIGVFKGGSLRLWKDYFPSAQITGVDLKLPPGFEGDDRIQVFAGSQGDPAFLDAVAKQRAPEGFDLIIDDASHYGDLTRLSFWHLYTHHLKPGGLFVIEDWGTGYLDGWKDGAAVRNPNFLQRQLSNLLQFVRLIPRDGPASHAFGWWDLSKSWLTKWVLKTRLGAQSTDWARRQQTNHGFPI